jgi:hypothetical protein
MAKGTQDAATPRSATARLTSNILIWVCNDLFQYTTSNTLTFAKIPVNVVRPSNIPIVRNNGEIVAIRLTGNQNTRYLSSHVSQCQHSWSFENFWTQLHVRNIKIKVCLCPVRLFLTKAVLNLRSFIEIYWKIFQSLKCFIMLSKTKEVSINIDINKD